MNGSTATADTPLRQASMRFLEHGGGQARRSVGRHTVSSMPSFLTAPRARLARRLGRFVTNRHE